MRSQRYIINRFNRIYESNGRSNKRFESRAAESVLDEYLKNIDYQIKVVADFNRDEEERFRRASWYDFVDHIDSLRRRKEDLEQPDN